jgi:C1A family cysteine protease
MKKNLLPICLFLLFVPILTSAQANKHPKGLLFNPIEYAKIPVAAKLTRGFYNLPKSYSLKKYAPTPGNQGQTGTCTAWSTAFHAITISESVKLNRTDINSTNQEAFSPSFIYNQIRSDQTCDNGTSIEVALRLMVTQGNMKIREFPFDCNAIIDSAILSKSENYKLSGYRTLFNQDANQKIVPVKKALSENNPVLIGMNAKPASFNNMPSDGLWNIPSDELLNLEPREGHAMTVIGYDDEVNGGSFEVINSWGEDWGNKGYFWIKYEDFSTLVAYAFELIRTPEQQFDLLANVDFNEFSGAKMNAHFDTETGIYKMDEPYTSGTQFRFYMNNNEPAYVYAIGSDLTNKSFRIFPFDDAVSPYLGYKSNTVAIPDEDHYIYMDDNKGMDYFCVLYSKNALDINQVLSELENTTGDFKTRLELVLKNKLINPKQIAYKNDTIGFEAKSGDQSIVPIIIEIIHN